VQIRGQNPSRSDSETARESAVLLAVNSALMRGLNPNILTAEATSAGETAAESTYGSRQSTMITRAIVGVTDALSVAAQVGT
jgi:hypothetical protein